MKSARRHLFAGLAAAAGFLTSPAHAQTYPDKPIHFIVPSAAGGLADNLARTVGEKIQQRLGQPIIVESRVGAGGLVGSEFVARSKPDGYTILIAPSSLALLGHTNKNMRFDVLKDLTPITKGLDLQNLLVAGASAPFKNFKELQEYAKRNPGKLSFGASGIGTTTHLGGELLKQRAGLDMVVVPYTGTPPMYAALIAGDIPLAVDSIAGSVPHIRSGKLHPIVVLSDRRSPALPDVPTAAEAGLTGVQAPVWIGFMAPAGTPPDVIARLNREISAALKSPDVAEKFRKLGAEPVGNTSEEYGRAIAQEIETWGNVIRVGKLKFE